jgi:hypothetical protein
MGRIDRRTAWRRRLVALAVLVTVVWLAVWGAGRLMRHGDDLTGEWAGSCVLLGDTQLRIERQGETYRIEGLRVADTSPDRIYSRAGRLYAEGGAEGARWTIVFELDADGQQLVARYEPEQGERETVRFTRPRPE